LFVINIHEDRSKNRKICLWKETFKSDNILIFNQNCLILHWRSQGPQKRCEVLYFLLFFIFLRSFFKTGLKLSFIWSSKYLFYAADIVLWTSAFRLFLNMLKLKLWRATVFPYSTIIKVCSVIFVILKNKSCKYDYQLKCWSHFLLMWPI